MANYPAYGQLLTSQHDPFDDLQVDRAIDGTGYCRAFYTGRKHRFILRHALTIAERDALLAFYDSNRGIPVDLVWQLDGSTYTALFMGCPNLGPVQRSGLVHAEVRLEPQ